MTQYGFTKEKIESLYHAQWCIRLVHFIEDTQMFIDGNNLETDNTNLANLQWLYNIHGFCAKNWMEPEQEEGYHQLLSQDDPNLLTREDGFLYLVLASGSTAIYKTIFNEKYPHLKLNTCIMLGLSAKEIGQLVQKKMPQKTYFAEKFDTAQKGDVNYPVIAAHLTICQETDCKACTLEGKENLKTHMANQFLNQKKKNN